MRTPHYYMYIKWTLGLAPTISLPVQTYHTSATNLYSLLGANSKKN